MRLLKELNFISDILISRSEVDILTCRLKREKKGVARLQTFILLILEYFTKKGKRKFLLIRGSAHCDFCFAATLMDA